MEPLPEDWFLLQDVLRNVESIIADGLGNGEGHYAGGLFVHSPIEGPPRAPKSALSDALSASSNPLHADATELAERFPGIDDLGSTRQERVLGLCGKLRSLTAYRWLEEQPDYVETLRILKTLAKREGEPWTRPEIALEITCILAYALPGYFISSSYPTVAHMPTAMHLDQAIGHAEKLAKFLKDHHGLVSFGLLQYGLLGANREIIIALRKVRRGYTQPNDGDAARSRLLDTLIANQIRQFGRCSATLTAAMAGIVDYRIDAPNIRKRIKQLQGQ